MFVRISRKYVYRGGMLVGDFFVGPFLDVRLAEKWRTQFKEFVSPNPSWNGLLDTGIENQKLSPESPQYSPELDPETVLQKTTELIVRHCEMAIG